MLDELRVANLGVLEDAHLEPGQGLTVVTGETGAGKTLLLGALRLLLGRPADSTQVGPFGDEATVEGRFVFGYAEERVVARRLSRNGRSRAYLDGSFASAAALEEATEGQVEIIGQHDHLTLTRPSEARTLVDRLLDEEGTELLAAYRRAWQQLGELREAQALLGGDRAALERERDLTQFQAREIEAAGFQAGDDEELERRLRRLRNLDELRLQMAAAMKSADQARQVLGEAVSALRKAASLDPDLSEQSDQLSGLEDQLGYVAIDLASSAEDLEGDPGALEEAEERHRALTDLRRKYGSTIEEVLAFGAEARRRERELTELLERAKSLDSEIETARRQVEELASQLTAARRRAGEVLASRAVEHLGQLGFTDPSLRVEIGARDPGPHGADEVKLLFASDRRLQPGEISKVASGGELSRLVLSLRLAGGAGTATTLAFDEIDAGVGGATALALAQKLAELAKGRQVLCVTHLPQIAAFAETHYVVRRSDHRAEVARVEGEARVEELSRMLAGLPESERGRQAAEELLGLASRS